MKNSLFVSLVFLLQFFGCNSLNSTETNSESFQDSVVTSIQLLQKQLKYNQVDSIKSFFTDSVEFIITDVMSPPTSIMLSVNNTLFGSEIVAPLYKNRLDYFWKNGDSSGLTFFGATGDLFPIQELSNPLLDSKILYELYSFPVQDSSIHYMTDYGYAFYFKNISNKLKIYKVRLAHSA